MLIDDTILNTKILDCYKNNCELKTMSEFDKGYFQCMIDIQMGKFNKKDKLLIVDEISKMRKKERIEIAKKIWRKNDSEL